MGRVSDALRLLPWAVHEPNPHLGRARYELMARPRHVQRVGPAAREAVGVLGHHREAEQPGLSRRSRERARAPPSISPGAKAPATTAKIGSGGVYDDAVMVRARSRPDGAGRAGIARLTE